MKITTKNAISISLCSLLLTAAGQVRAETPAFLRAFELFRQKYMGGGRPVTTVEVKTPRSAKDTEHGSPEHTPAASSQTASTSSSHPPIEPLYLRYMRPFEPETEPTKVVVPTESKPFETRAATPARVPASRFEDLGAKNYHAVTRTIGDPSAEKKDRVIFLHGAGQETDNDLFNRFVASLGKTQFNGTVTAVPWDGRAGEAQGDLVQLIKSAAYKSLVIAGHSAGGGEAADLMKRYPQKFKAAVLINPVVSPGDMPVPTLFVRGDADNCDPKCEYAATMGKKRDNLWYFPVPGADHSLRHRPKELYRSWKVGPEEKAALSSSAETRAMNEAVAETIAGFLRQDRDMTPLMREGRQMAVMRLAPDLVRAVHRVPRDVRREALATLRRNRQAIEDMKRGKEFYGSIDEGRVTSEQAQANRIALKKLLTMQDAGPRYEFVSKLVGVPQYRPTSRRAKVLLTSQPTRENLRHIVREAGDKGIRPEEIAVVNLRAENNQEADWIQHDTALKGVRAVHAGYLDHSIPSFEQVKAALLPMTDPGIKLVILHCHRGKGRTNTLMAAARIALDNWKTWEALGEARAEGLDRPIQVHFVEQFGKAVEAGQFSIQQRSER